MSAKKLVWSFRDEKTEKQVDGLNFKQAAFVNSMIPASARFSWLVWHEGLTDWMSLDECTHFNEENAEKKTAPPPAPPEKSKPKAAAPSSRGKTSSDADLNRRLNRRFAKHFKVSINLTDKVFTTHTLNLSMGGMLLEHTLPEELGKSFGVKLQRYDGTSVDLFCSAIPVPDGGRSRRVRIIGAKQEGLFRTWLLDPSLG